MPTTPTATDGTCPNTAHVSHATDTTNFSICVAGFITSRNASIEITPGAIVHFFLAGTPHCIHIVWIIAKFGMAEGPVPMPRQISHRSDNIWGSLTPKKTPKIPNHHSL